ncbi:hypothetical protein A3758_08295 [Oleiphilus sp. HI0118]|nr:hypothetical protein A3758_08295 [Oleiphilus sp. HI0118]
MTDKEVEPSVSVENSEALANEWVAHLKKQSKFRLAMLGVASIGFAVSAGVLTNTTLEKNALELELSAKSALIAELESDVSLKSNSIAELNDQLTSAQKRTRFLEQVKGDTASQLGIAEQIIDTQKQKIALIKEEFSSSSQLVSELEMRLAESQKKARTLQSTLNGKVKELGQRSAAYNAIVKRQKDTRAEVDRLAVALEEAESARTAATQRLASVKGQLSNSNNELGRLRKEITALNQELLVQRQKEAKPEQVSQDQRNLAIQPIIGQASVDNSGSVVLKSNPGVVDPNALMIE